MTFTTEMRNAARRLIRAKQRLWYAALELESLTKFEILSNSPILESVAAEHPDTSVIDPLTDDVVDKMLLEFEQFAATQPIEIIKNAS